MECGECEMNWHVGYHLPDCSRYKPEAEIACRLEAAGLISDLDIAKAGQITKQVISEWLEIKARQAEAQKGEHHGR